jgi:hypothetical protein
LRTYWSVSRSNAADTGPAPRHRPETAIRVRDRGRRMPNAVGLLIGTVACASCRPRPLATMRL